MQMVDSEQAAETRTKADSIEDEKTPTFSSGRVLVVDDTDANRMLIRVALTRAGLEVIEAENGQEALDVIAGTSVDVVLMDMQMPVMDGYTATRTLRQQGCKLPIIALTANAMEGDREKCSAAGCTGFLSKPIGMHDLLRSMSKFFQNDSKAEVKRLNAAEVPPTVVAAAKSEKINPQEFVYQRVKDRLNQAIISWSESDQPGMADAIRLMIEATHATRDESLMEQTDRLANAFKQGSDIEDCLGEIAITLESAGRQVKKSSGGVSQVAEDDQGSLVASAAKTDRPMTTDAANQTSGGPSLEPLVSTLPTDGDPEMASVVAVFVGQLRAKRAEMRLAFQRQDLDELASLAHWLKGSGGTMGFDQLSVVGLEFEESILSQRVHEFEVHLDRIDALAQRIRISNESTASC